MDWHLRYGLSGMRTSAYLAHRMVNDIFPRLCGHHAPDSIPMKIERIWISILATVWSTIFQLDIVLGQVPMDRGYGARTWTSAVKAVQEGDTTRALDLLASVSPNDSVYERILMGRLDLLVEKGAYSEAGHIALEGAALRSARSGVFATQHVALLYDQGRFDACIQAADSLINARPALHRPHHLKALALQRKGDVNGALRASMENVKRFPLNRAMHFHLAEIAAKEGYPSLSALAGAMAQIVQYGDQMAVRILIQQDGMLNGKYEREPSGVDMRLASDGSQELDELVRSQVALDKKYEVDPDLPYPICRQSHLIFSEVARTQGKGFYHEFYGPLIREIMEKDLFEGYVLHCLASSDIDKVRAVADRGRSKVEAFRAHISKFLDQRYCATPGPDGLLLYRGFGDGGDLGSMGPTNEAVTQRLGQWTFFHPNGYPRSQGSYDADGQESGLWRGWFENGELSFEGNYTKGVAEGLRVTRYVNGAILDSAVYTSGKVTGAHVKFWHMGGVSSRKFLKEDVGDGPVVEYHRDGSPSWRYTLLKGQVDGPVEQFHPNGKSKLNGTLSADVRSGTFTEFHENGTMSDEYSYSAGEVNGPAKQWYPNGERRSEATILNGKQSGQRLEYDAWGTLVSTTSYDEQGRLHGPYEEMRKDGTLSMRAEYSKDMLMRYTWFDRTGKVLTEAKRSKGKFDFVSYHPSGAPNGQGTYLAEGGKDGRWEYRYPDGTLDAVEIYEDGEQVGERIDYDPCGSKRSVDRPYTEGGEKYLQHIEYYPSGAIKEVGTTKKGVYEGVYERYGPDGVKWAIEYYYEDEREGWQFYFDRSGRPWYSEKLSGGLLAERMTYDTTGAVLEHLTIPPGKAVIEQHWPDGSVLSTEEYLNGERHGRIRYFYPDGKLELEGEYRGGERAGTWTSLYPNGRTRYTSTYVDGRLEGVRSEYSMDGTIASSYTYVFGQLQGEGKEYHVDGSVASRRAYVNDVRHGPMVDLDPTGAIQAVRFYHKGELLGYGVPGRDGSVVDTIPLSDANAELTTVYPSGGPARSMRFRNGVIDGEFKEYSSTGSLLESGTFQCGMQVNERVIYHANGRPRSVTPYSDGLIHGASLFYRPDGTLEERITYVHGVQHGPWTVHDAKGQTTVTYIMQNNNVIAIRR